MTYEIGKGTLDSAVPILINYRLNDLYCGMCHISDGLLFWYRTSQSGSTIPRTRPYLHDFRLQKVMKEYLLNLGSAVCTIFFLFSVQNWNAYYAEKLILQTFPYIVYIIWHCSVG